MATKWKSTMKDSGAYLKSHKSVVLGVLAAVLGFAGFYILFRNQGVLNTRNVWLAGVVCNFFTSAATLIFLPLFLERAHRSFVPENGDFYERWKAKNRHQQQIICIIFGFLFLLALAFFNYQMRYGWYGWYYNYAMGYLLIATVILQFFLAEFCVGRFMRTRLDDMMKKVSEINRQRLAEAVEIERQSLEKAAKSEQLKVDLISNVSHDLKTPLTSMVGYLELLKKEELDDVCRDYVDVISDKAEKLKEMIESLFALAKASSGNIQLHPEAVEINRLLEQILADMDGQIAGSDLHFVTSLTEEDTHLMTDNLLMYRICQNLIENALKYAAKGTRVFVKTYFAETAPGRRLCLEITNTAGYFMDFDKDDILERFARGDKARSSEGNGLGLAIVSTYAGALGGAFDIHIDCDQFKAELSFPVCALNPVKEETENLKIEE